ncbi:M20/M25/M40 family metallo-hydrolase [Steroidobacter sp.]|uniref:M20/M25/M40 family metallo-hydrolase n=1 Tax=Steroidobacter sp. TaxID=1978227 RepID=UPI001A363859|nr:M20/M25/M40 family metallo-hydrolase [Steroidobacter sp.]MBL8264847.1 M20/M25/M40 family metallo-hydrolase [Steroidobacter sp.]
MPSLHPRSAALAALLALSAPFVFASETVDLQAINRITDEAFNRSEIPQTAAYLSDRIGARLTNSPQMREAERWTQEQFRQWGLKNVRAEGFDFGRGWSIERASVRMVAPRVRTMQSIPIAWTPATPGAVSAPIIVAPLRTAKDFEKWRGQLRGKIVLVSQPGTSAEPTEADFKRFTREELDAMTPYPQPTHSEAQFQARRKRASFDEQRDEFLAAEGALLWVRRSNREGGLVEGSSYGADSSTVYGYLVGRTPKLPAVELAAEDYRLLARLAKAGTAPAIEVISDVKFHDDDHRAYNIIAELPGRDAKAGYVLAGAHLDSWVAADGAADNAAGSAVVMEAARILNKLNFKPKRAIHFALWNAEEPGLLGSIAYLDQHLVSRPPVTDQDTAKLNPYFSRSWLQRWPITPKPGHAQLTAYFNLDNGSGKIRGINAEGNLAAMPVFKQWLAPFASMGADTVVPARAGGTDHAFMQAVGLPGFQFIQDPLDYESRVHHTQIDTYDHLRIEDMKQAAVILASFLLQAANRDEPLPRMPLPTQPAVTDPFLYDDVE